MANASGLEISHSNDVRLSGVSTVHTSNTTALNSPFVLATICLRKQSMQWTHKVILYNCSLPIGLVPRSWPYPAIPYTFMNYQELKRKSLPAINCTVAPKAYFWESYSHRPPMDGYTCPLKAGYAETTIIIFHFTVFMFIKANN